MQIVMSINTTEQDESILGLQLSIIEGEYDDVIDWPFNYNYTLTFMKQKNILQEFNSQNDTDVSISIHPSASSCPKSSFQKPIERNTPCGDENLITLDDASKQLDNLLVKATIYFT